jgi:hypothetical protein
MESSPFRVVSWPFWEMTQLPPDCFKHPRSTVSWPLEVAVVELGLAWVLGVVLGVVDCCWSVVLGWV